MTWRGTWRNQHGSVVEIHDDTGGRITGTFTTALKDSGFHGQTLAIQGVCQGECIAFASAGATQAGDAVVSYTGLLRDGALETMWLMVADQRLGAATPDHPAQLEKQAWWRAVTTNHDRFERVTDAAPSGTPSR